MSGGRFGDRQARRKAEREGHAPSVVGPNGQPIRAGGEATLSDVPDQSVCPLLSSFAAVAMPSPEFKQFVKDAGPGVVTCFGVKCSWWAPEADPKGPVHDGCTVLRFCRGIAPVLDGIDTRVDDLVSAAQNAGLLEADEEPPSEPHVPAGPRDPEPEVYE